MNAKVVSVSLGLPIVLLLGTLPPQDAAPKVAIRDVSPVVGVVDIERVLKVYPKRATLREALNGEGAKIQSLLDEMKTAAEKLNTEISSWETGTAQWADAQVKFEGALAAYNSRVKVEETRFKVRKYQVRAELYNDIERAIAELAKSKKIQLVLRWRQIPPKASLEEQLLEATQRDVLYFDGKLDLSADVINLLKTKAYSGSGSSAPGNGK